jgi:hypothetical protein
MWNIELNHTIIIQCTYSCPDSVVFCLCANCQEQKGKDLLRRMFFFFPSPSLFINSFGISKPSGIIKISELVGHVSETRQSVKIYTLNNKKKDFSILFFSLINIRYFTVWIPKFYPCRKAEERDINSCSFFGLGDLYILEEPSVAIGALVGSSPWTVPFILFRAHELHRKVVRSDSIRDSVQDIS